MSIDVTKTVEEIKRRSIEDQRMFLKEMSIKLNQFTKDPNYNLSYRNKLAKIIREIKKDLPYQFEKGQEVYMKLLDNRKIKGIIKSVYDENFRLLLVQPIDTVYKEPVAVPESLLEPLEIVSKPKQLELSLV